MPDHTDRDARASAAKHAATHAATHHDTHYNTIVIGAGAAGLAAARTLQDGNLANHRVLVLEARDRIGGRVNTDDDFAPHPVELGAEYLHGENIITWRWVRQQRLATLPAFDEDAQQWMYINQTLLPFRRWSILPGMDALDGIDDAQIAALITAWVAEGKPDISVAQFLSLHDTRYGITTMSPEVYCVLNHYISANYGATLEQLGVYGLLELSYEGDGEDNFRVQKGYARVLEPLAAGLTIHYQTSVTHIAWQQPVLEVHTNTTTYTADHIVITLPLALLQSNAVTFEPELPAAKRSAIDGLGVGSVTKLIFQFDAPFWVDDMESCLTTLDTQLWWRPGWQRDDEAAILTAYTGATAALQLGALGREGAIERGLQHLEQMFAMPLAERLLNALFIDWQADPYARMAYSYVPVNGAGLRAQLAAPLEGVLFFAGEATHPTRAATVHGALESGIRAANEILALA